MTAHPPTHSEGVRSAFHLTVIGVTMLLVLFNFVGLALATLPGSSFDGTDGVLDDDGDLLHLTDACGAEKEDAPINGAPYQLNVIHDTPPPVLSDSIANADKADICQIWIDSETVPNGNGDDFLLYVAWERAKTTGSTVVFWEFHTQPLTCAVVADDCNPFHPRSDGDFLLTYDFQGNQIDLEIRFWNAAENKFDPPSMVLPTDSEASLSADTSFGEAVLNLSDLNIIMPSDDECQSLAGVIPGSITGNSDSADYKDIVLTGADPGITNCGTVVVEKEVEGGNDFGQDFDISLSNGDGLIHSEGLGHGDSYTVIDQFEGNDYEVSETVPAGWSITGIDCTDGSSTDGATLTGISVSAGETTTCTVTNAPDLPTITLVKNAVGDNIGEDDFQASLNGGDVDWDATTEVAPGSHSIAEAIAAGSDVQDSWFMAGTWSCDNGDFGAADGASVTVGLGDDVTCTITNTELPSTLTLHKIVDNGDGGNDTQDDFQARIDGDPVDWDVAYDVEALVEHTASEDSPLPGYTPGTWTGDCAADGTVTLEPGQDGVCTITNDDNPPTVTVIKEVVNDNGGTAVPGDFTLHVGNADLASGDTVNVPANTDVVVGEDFLPGYVLDSIECSDGTSLEGEDLTVTLNLDEGEDVTCTIVNDDLPASVTLVKNVVNDDGATATADDFQAYIDGNPVDWGVSVDLPAGQYVASEDSLEGYVATDWGGDCAADGSVTLGLGEHLVCTITNDDLPAEIDVVKDATDGVVADEEGNLVATFDPTDDDDETVTYTYVVTNTGDVALENVTLVDDVLGPIALPQTTLDPGESITVTAVHTLSDDDGDVIVNVATVTGDPIHGGPEVDDDDDETVFVIEVLPETLPETGLDSVALAVIALLLLVGGTTMVGGSRIRLVPALARVRAVRSLRQAQHARRHAVTKLTSGTWPHRVRHRW